MVYHLSLVFTLIVSALAYWFLYEFSNEMAQFEFQPDQQIMDQFVQIHSIIITGINPNISPETGEKAIKKVFTMRFGEKNI